MTLRHNNISYIRDGAFGAFSCTLQEFRLDLSYNNISSFSNGALFGLENCNLQLNLNFNRIEKIPHALAILTNLKSLQLLGNPLINLDTSALVNAGSTLSDFRFDLRHFSTWPDVTLQLMLELETLETVGIPFEHIENTAFNHMTRLKHLKISDTKLIAIPKALCNLNSLTTLNISNNAHFNNSGYSIFEVCGASNRSTIQLDNLFFYGNKVNIFPNFMTMFPRIRKIGVGNNIIESMNEDTLSGAPGLRAINMDDNLFTRIPYALNKFTELTYVSLSDNRISSVEGSDLAQLHDILTLDLDHNPLLYITHNAFENNPRLSTVYLSGTYLQTIPVALTMLPSLSVVTLNDARVTCTCDMPHLQHWTQANSIYFRNATCSDKPLLLQNFISEYPSVCMSSLS